MLRTGVTVDDLALCCGVDPKTAERWISPGRVPHRTHRWTAARRLRYDESYLWPDVARPTARRAETAQSELVRLYPDRASVPRETWLRMMTDASEHIDVLVFSGTFYVQTQPKVARMLADAAERGTEVRLCFGNPDCEAVATRDREEELGGTLAAKIRSALTYYRPLADVDGMEMRLHSTTLYSPVVPVRRRDHGQSARLRGTRLSEPDHAPAPPRRQPARRALHGLLRAGVGHCEIVVR